MGWRNRLLGFCAFLYVVAPVAARAEELDDNLKKVRELVDQKLYSKALTELSWARTAIEKMHMKRVEDYFPEKVGEFAGGKFESSAALGMNNVERSYSKPGSSAIKVSLAGGSGGQNNPFAAIAGFGRMAAMMPGMQGTGKEQVRIAGRTAMLEAGEEQGKSELTIFLESGSVLTLETSTKDAGSTLKTLAEGLKIAELDDYLKG